MPQLFSSSLLLVQIAKIKSKKPQNKQNKKTNQKIPKTQQPTPNPKIKERLFLLRASLVNNDEALCEGDIVLFQVIFAQLKKHGWIGRTQYTLSAVLMIILTGSMWGFFWGFFW